MIEEYELPMKWVWTTIGEVAETTSGGTPSRHSSQYYNGTIPWVKSGELEDNVITNVEEFITEEGLKNSNAKVFHQGTALVAMYGATVGKTGILGIDATTNQAICAIFPRQNAFISKFIVYWLQAQRQTLIDQSFGGAQPNINQGIIRAFPMPLAPLPEQHRIVAAVEQQFTRLDAAVTALQHARTKLKRYRAAVLKAAVEGKLTEAWRAEHPSAEPASALLERILVERRAKWEADQRAKGKDPAKVKYIELAAPDVSGLPELPEGWCWASVEQLASSEPRSIQSGPFGSALLHSEFQKSGILAIGIDNVLDGTFSMGSQHRISIKKYEGLQKFTARPLDVLITVMATVGRCCVVPADLEIAIITKHVYRISANLGLISPHFLMLSLSTGEVRRQLFEKVQGQTRPGINGEILRKLAIPLPSLDEQQQIVSEVERRLSIVTQLETTVEANLKRAGRLRQSILKEAFAGRLVPQDPNDEPVSMLMERIHKEREEQKPGPIKKPRELKTISVPRMPDVEPIAIDTSEMEQMDLWASIGSRE